MTKSSETELHDLYLKIEEICKHLKEIRGEAASIVASSGVPDATLHLHDVLKSTEQATMTILDSATAIGAAIDADGVPQSVKDKVGEQVGKIYESCSFQDISGQQIKRVLNHLEELEDQLQGLSETAKGKQEGAAKAKQKTPKSKDPLLNGPQLSGDAPSQEDIDKLFGS